MASIWNTSSRMLTAVVYAAYAGLVHGANATSAISPADDNAVTRFVAQHAALTSTAAGLTATYAFLWALLHFTQDDKEPPLVLTGVPFLSPIIGAVKWSMGFYNYMRDKYPHLPIFTLRLPGLRVYIVNSTNLIPVVQRQWRTLIFPPVSARASEVAMGGSKEGMAIIRDDMITETGFMHAFTKAIHPALSSGPALDELNGAALDVLSKSLDSIKGPKRVNMFEWIRHELLMATTDGVYGPSNPLRDPAREADWVKFHPTIMFLMLNVLPLWAFGGAITARNRLASAFQRYHEAGHWRQGSSYIQRWTEHFVSRGIDPVDLGRFHNAGLFALVANTIPTAFWTIFCVFSDAEVARECREEVERCVTIEKDKECGEEVCMINAARIKNSCPTLVSTFQEVFRFYGMANSVRVVNEDHVLDGKYLLKKGGLVMIPARVQHRLKEVWGENVDEFDHRRFIRKPGEPRPNPIAFRGFGGGTTLCPGRHFATTEILVFTAMLLMRFDLVPVEGGGKWVTPTIANSSQAEAMAQPDQDIQIELRPRPGAEREWRVCFDGAGEAALVAEDL